MDRSPLDPDRLSRLLGARWVSASVVARTQSTNADLVASAAAGAAAPALLVAEEQVAGRGRFDRVWSSPPSAGLTFSILLRPTAPLATWGWLPLLAGVALVEAVRATTSVAAVLKWPNDLLASPGGGKLAGILAQSANGAVVIGIGLNVSTARDELPVDTASSLTLEGGGPDVDRTALLAAIATSVDTWATRWDAAGGDAESCGLGAAYRAACATIDRPVRVTLGDDTSVVGTAAGIDSHGALVVRSPSGDRTVSAGDVTHLRPA